MQYIVISFVILAFGASVSVQQCDPNQITELTNNYYALLQYYEDNQPVTLSELSVSAQKIFNELLNMVGLAGDIPWTLDVLGSLLHDKGYRQREYIHYVSDTLKQYFDNVYMPAIRNAVGQFLWDPQIQSLLYQMLQNWNERLKYVEQKVKDLDDEDNLLFDLVKPIILDISQRALAARTAGQRDLSAFESEMKGFQASQAVKLAAYTKDRDDSFGDGVQELIGKFMVIVNALKQRCLYLLSATQCAQN